MLVQKIDKAVRRLIGHVLVNLRAIGGFAMGLSSTAVVIGLVRERDQEDCPVGRAAQSILKFMWVWPWMFVANHIKLAKIM